MLLPVYNNQVKLNVVDNPIYDFSPLIGLESLHSIKISWDVTSPLYDMSENHLTVELEILDPTLNADDPRRTHYP